MLKLRIENIMKELKMMAPEDEDGEDPDEVTNTNIF